jgi:hypothetical protein
MTTSYNQDQIKSALETLGYTLQDRGKDWRARPLYRDSDNDTSLSIRKEDGYWIDFARNHKGKIEDLIELTLDKPKGFASKWLTGKGFVQTQKTQQQIREEAPITYPRYFDPSLLSKLENNHQYWLNRGISEETIKTFCGGNCKTGKMIGRYVFPIFDIEKNIRGFAGRSIYKNEIKWKLIGRRSEWQYPLFLTRDYIQKEKSCFLIESIGDGLKLWDSGIRNFIICFGINSLEHIYYELVGLDPEKIFISFNDDTKSGKSGGAGNFAAKKAARELLVFFEKRQIEIKLPDKNDFGEMSTEEIKQWKNK